MKNPILKRSLYNVDLAGSNKSLLKRHDVKSGPLPTVVTQRGILKTVFRTQTNNSAFGTDEVSC